MVYSGGVSTRQISNGRYKGYLERLIREVRKMAFASDQGMTQSGGGGKRRRGNTEKPVVPAKHRVVELGSLYVPNANTLFNLFFFSCLVQSWPLSISVSF